MNDTTMMVVMHLFGPPLALALCVPLCMALHAWTEWQVGRPVPASLTAFLRRMSVVCVLHPLQFFSAVVLATYLELLTGWDPLPCVLIALPATLGFWGWFLRKEFAALMRREGGVE